MFDRLTKKISGKVTDATVEGAKKSVNDRMDQYGDIIQIGLVLLVIGIGGKHLIGIRRPREERYIPETTDRGQPIIINNYYREREERYERRHQRECYIENGQIQQRRPAQKENQKYQNRR